MPQWPHPIWRIRGAIGRADECRRRWHGTRSVIELPTAADPLVSVVVLVTREAEFAERCLRAIADGHEPDVPTEVVLVLGAPDADTLALVEERVSGARIVARP